MTYRKLGLAVGLLLGLGKDPAFAVVINETTRTDVTFTNQQVQAGVVVLCEFGAINGGRACAASPNDENPLSDAVNFSNLNGNGQASMNSDSEDTDRPQPGVDDSAVMSAVITRALRAGLPVRYLSEGAENTVQSVAYTATVGLPGYDTTNMRSVQYRLVSDTPEPSTFLMIGVGVAGLLGARRGPLFSAGR